METTNEQQKKTKPKKKGKKKNSNFLPYKEAQEFVQSECITSRNQYETWFQQNKPKVVPRFPYRVYTQEWTSWNDFLGTNNKFFTPKKQYRPYNEAVLWVHQLGLKGHDDWFEYCRAEDSTLPPDIPMRPDIVYRQHWRSWNHWIGNKAQEKVEAAKEAQRVALFYIIHEVGDISNVFTFGIEPNGVSALKARWEREQFQVVQIFYMDQTKMPDVARVLDSMSSPYQDNNQHRIVPNVYDLIWHIQKFLDPIK